MTATFPWSRTLAVAHRGAHGHGRPENSLAAVQAALSLGALAVEIDAGEVEPGRIAVAHDDDRRGSAEPLEPFLDLIAESEAFLVLDWKGRAGAPAGARLLQERGLAERALISTGNADVLAELHEAEPTVRLGLTVSERDERDTGKLSARLDSLLWSTGAVALMLERGLATRTNVRRVRERGLGLFFWTAQTRSDYVALARFAPDGVMTDAFEATVSR